VTGIQSAGSEIVWFHGESHGDLGIRSNFGSFIARMSGIYGTDPSTEMDGRVLLAAARHRRISRALATLSKEQRDVLKAWAEYPDNLGVMLISDLAASMHRKSGTSLGLPDWLQRKARAKAPEWFRIHIAAASASEHAILAFDRALKRHG
jgi:hypothetical protein